MPISVVINTYNSELHLKKVLESVKDFDEILICDMESTDNTLSIAQQYGARIVTFPKGNLRIVEPAREFAIHNAKHNWVLVIDSDEVVPVALKDYLYNIIEKQNNFSGLYISRKNYFLGRFMHCFYPDRILRFFDKNVTHWPETIHSTPQVKGKVLQIDPKRKELALEHLALDTISDRLNKISVYSDYEIERKKDKKYGTLALIYRPFMRFFKLYVLKKGFLDKTPGLIASLLEGYYQMVIVAKLIEKRKKKNL